MIQLPTGILGAADEPPILMSLEMLPLSDGLPARRFPVINVLLLAANLAAWLFYELPHLNAAVYHASFYPCAVDNACHAPEPWGVNCWLTPHVPARQLGPQPGQHAVPGHLRQERQGRLRAAAPGDGGDGVVRPGQQITGVPDLLGGHGRRPPQARAAAAGGVKPLAGALDDQLADELGQRGEKVRMRAKLVAVEEIPGGAQITTELTFEREGGDKPACAAESLARVYLS